MVHGVCFRGSLCLRFSGLQLRVAAVHHAAYFALPTPFHFGPNVFGLAHYVGLCLFVTGRRRVLLIL